VGQRSSSRRHSSGSLIAVLSLLLEIGAQTVLAQGAPRPGPPYPGGFPDDPAFFPIGVWLQSPSSAPAYKALGINTFVGLWGGPTEDQLTALATSGMFAIAAQNKTGLTSPHRDVIKAWMHEDEPDNAQKNALGLHISCVPPQQVAKRTQEMRRRDATRPIFINFGRAVADTQWHGRGTCTGNTGYYAIASKGVDIVSFDIYPVAGSDPPVKGRLEYVARGVANLQTWAREARWVWTFVETTRIGHETDRATPDQIRAEVWLALIQGATGIGYFVHEFSGGFREDGIFRYPDAVDAVTRINAEILDLAPVLNSPTLRDRVSVMDGASIAAAAKDHGGALYVFAAATTDARTRAKLAVPGLKKGKAHVIGENRAVEIRDGVIEDDVGGYAVHLYRIEP
jgi:hypothetical protein